MVGGVDGGQATEGQVVRALAILRGAGGKYYSGFWKAGFVFFSQVLDLFLELPEFPAERQIVITNLSERLSS